MGKTRRNLSYVWRADCIELRNRVGNERDPSKVLCSCSGNSHWIHHWLWRSREICKHCSWSRSPNNSKSCCSIWRRSCGDFKQTWISCLDSSSLLFGRVGIRIRRERSRTEETSCSMSCSLWSGLYWQESSRVERSWVRSGSRCLW